jgi:adhesin transport system outer membrane protein
MQKKIIALSLALMGIGANAATLNEVTERAISRSPDVKARLHAFLSSREDQSAGAGAWRPRVDLNAYTGRETLDTPNTANSSFTHSETSLQLRQLLFDGGAARSEIRRLGHTKAIRYFELLQTTDEVALESARAYLDLHRYRQLARLAQDNWAVHKETYDQIAEKVKAGVGRKVDLEQAGGRLALAQSNWLIETSNLHDVGARFERIVGEQPPVLAEVPAMAGKLPAERELISTAVRSSPGFLASVASLRAARAQLDIRRSANAPTIEFRASAGAGRNRQGVTGTYRDTAAQIVLNYNLYNGNADSARIRSAQESLSVAKEQRDRSCRDIRQVTSIAWNDVRKLREQIRYLEQHALSTEKARDAYRQQFDIGQRSLLDVLDTENELFQARRALTTAQQDLKLAEFRVLGATHQLLPALGLAAPVENAISDRPEDLADDMAITCSTVVASYEGLDIAGAMAQRPPRSTVEPTPVKTASAPAEKEPPAKVAAECEATVKEWASAWTAKDLTRYLSFYSTAFKPERTSESNWKALRAQRLKKPSIEVRVSQLSTTEQDASRCAVSFKQQYRSSDFNDDTVKTLNLRKEGKDWRIVGERAVKQ